MGSHPFLMQRYPRYGLLVAPHPLLFLFLFRRFRVPTRRPSPLPLLHLLPHHPRPLRHLPLLLEAQVGEVGHERVHRGRRLLRPGRRRHVLQFSGIIRGVLITGLKDPESKGRHSNS